jgi:hypothetical protein
MKYEGIAQDRRNKRNRILTISGLTSVVSVVAAGIAFGAFKCEKGTQREIQNELHNIAASETCKILPASQAFQNRRYGEAYRMASSALYHMANAKDDYDESGNTAAARDKLWGETADTLTTLKIASAARIRASGEHPAKYWAAP